MKASLDVLWKVLLLNFESINSSLSILYSLGLLTLLCLLSFLHILFRLLHFASLALLANDFFLLLLLLFLFFLLFLVGLVFLGFLFDDDFFIGLILGVLCSGDALRVITIEKSLLLQLTQYSFHGILVLARLRTRGNKLQTLLNLISKWFTNLCSRVLGETVNSTSNCTLVCQISWDLTLVSSASTPNEGWVEKETVLGCLALGLESTEKCLFSSEDLDCGSRIFWEICETSSMCDKFWADNFSNESLKVWSHSRHSLL